MEATAVADDVHQPPGVAEVYVVVAPRQSESAPEMAAGRALTVTMAVPMQPAPVVYVMTVVPVATPVTTPPVMLIAATAGLAELHHPPAGESVSVAPTHMLLMPVMEGDVLTVTISEVPQPVAAT